MMLEISSRVYFAERQNGIAYVRLFINRVGKSRSCPY